MTQWLMDYVGTYGINGIFWPVGGALVFINSLIVLRGI